MAMGIKRNINSSEVLRVAEPPNERPPFYSRHNRVRTMPIVNAMGTRGFYLFASQQSFDMFKNTGFKQAKLNAEGVGIPLFHMLESYDIVAWFLKKKPVYIVHKFIIQKLDDPPPYTESKLVLQDDELCLYKVPFCEIFQKMRFSSCTYSFKFPFHPEGSDASYELVDNYNFQNYKTLISGQDLAWKSDLDFTFETWDYKLCLDSGKKTPIATYSTQDCDYLPKKTFKCANLFIQEETGPEALGNTSVAWLTQILACQGVLIHRIIRDSF
ncbi:uncharacterized protein ZBIST_0579 [Zygosaccharomyces bailii]|nr:uncharacterized protein ZBIST_0579 [Zygosaccharomyces bailii]